jgi:serine/threonine-protein kinase
VYSLGCVLYELLTGEVPYGGDNFVSVAMRHVNDPVPSVRDERPDVPPRLDWAIQQAMAKDREQRYASMSEFAAELEACYVELDGDEGATMIGRAGATLVRPPAARATRRRRRPIWPIVLLGVALAALLGGLVGLLAFRHNDGGGSQNTPPATASRIHLRGVGAYDPDGTGGEHDSDAPKAADGDPTTYWTTETYNSGLQKPGVGVVLDAGRVVSPKTIRVTTDTDGFTAEIRAGGSKDGPFSTRISPPEHVSGTTSFPIRGRGRYFVIWITDLGSNSAVHVNEVRAVS